MSIGGQPPGPAPKVPVWRTAIESYRFVFSNLGRLLALSWPLMVIGAAALIVGGRSGWGAETLQHSPAYVVANILFAVVFFAMYIVFVVRWHRFFLLDDRESVFSEILAARNWRFLSYFLLLNLAPFLPMLIVVNIGFVASIFGADLPPEGMVTGLWVALFIFAWLPAFVLYFVFFRFSLVLPAVAVDRPIGLGESWHRLRGNTRRYKNALTLVAIPTIIVGFILMVPFLVASMPSGGPRPSMTVLVVWMLVIIIFVIFATASWMTVLSKFYRHIVGMEAPEGGAAADPA